MPLFAALSSLTTVGGMRFQNGPVNDIQVHSSVASQSITVTRGMPRMPPGMPAGPFPGDAMASLDGDMPPSMLPPLPGSNPPRPFIPQISLAGGPCVTRIGGRGITNRRGECVVEGAPCKIGACKPGTDCQMKEIRGAYNRRGVCVQEGAQCHYGCDERLMPPGAVCVPGPGEWDREGKCVPRRFVDNRTQFSENSWQAPMSWLERHSMPVMMPSLPPAIVVPPPAPAGPMPLLPPPMMNGGVAPPMPFPFPGPMGDGMMAGGPMMPPPADFPSMGGDMSPMMGGGDMFPMGGSDGPMGGGADDMAPMGGADFGSIPDSTSEFSTMDAIDISSESSSSSSSEMTSMSTSMSPQPLPGKPTCLTCGMKASPPPQKRPQSPPKMDRQFEKVDQVLKDIAAEGYDPLKMLKKVTREQTQNKFDLEDVMKALERRKN